MPPETRIGHFHLYIAELQQAMAFYHGVLGFDDMGYAREFRMGMVSAGRYHHHVGLNTWMGEGAPPAPPGALGLRHISFVLPSPAELERVVAHVRQAGLAVEQTELGPLVRDPSQNAVFESPEKTKAASDRNRSPPSRFPVHREVSRRKKGCGSPTRSASGRRLPSFRLAEQIFIALSLRHVNHT